MSSKSMTRICWSRFAMRCYTRVRADQTGTYDKCVQAETYTSTPSFCEPPGCRRRRRYPFQRFRRSHRRHWRARQKSTKSPLSCLRNILKAIHCMKNKQTLFNFIIYIYVYHRKGHGWSARCWLIRRVSESRRVLCDRNVTVRVEASAESCSCPLPAPVVLPTTLRCRMFHSSSPSS
jgi:hypothetical protein